MQQKRYTRSERFTSLRDIWMLFNQFQTLGRRGVELDLRGPVLSLRDCSNIKKTLERHGLCVEVPIRKYKTVKYYSIYVMNDNKDKLWLLFDQFERARN